MELATLRIALGKVVEVKPITLYVVASSDVLQSLHNAFNVNKTSVRLKEFLPPTQVAIPRLFLEVLIVLVAYEQELESHLLSVP